MFGSNTETFSVKVDFKDCLQFVDDLKNKQIPYVTARTLTALAQGGQWDLRQDMGRHFHLRSGKRLRAGIRIEPAKKSDFFSGNIFSAVKDIDPFMGIHTVGGTKEPEKHKYLSVPSSYLIGSGARTSSGAIKERFKPSTIIAKIKRDALNQRNERGRFIASKGRKKKPTPFIMPIGRDHAVIAQRTGAGRFPLVYLFGFEEKAKIKETWPFVETVGKYVEKNAQNLFAFEFRQAMATANP
jgi:hypothetical protein